MTTLNVVLWAILAVVLTVFPPVMIWCVKNQHDDRSFVLFMACTIFGIAATVGIVVYNINSTSLREQTQSVTKTLSSKYNISVTSVNLDKTSLAFKVDGRFCTGAYLHDQLGYRIISKSIVCAVEDDGSTLRAELPK